jgi:hypothetical protein
MLQNIKLKKIFLKILDPVLICGHMFYTVDQCGADIVFRYWKFQFF